MPKNHRVKRGDCVSSIAFRNGLHPDTIWDRPENAALRELRKDPNVLFEGDVVFVPDLRIRTVEGATGRRHIFRRRGVPEVYRARFLERDGRPRAGVPYRFSCGGATREGTTDADGAIRECIAPDAPRAELVLLVGEREERYRIELGRLDPVTELSGVKARLNGLGFPCGPADATMNEATAAALCRFQRAASIPVTGEVDDATRAALVDRFGG